MDPRKAVSLGQAEEREDQLDESKEKTDDTGEKKKYQFLVSREKCSFFLEE